jgi:hypothetical protein
MGTPITQVMHAYDRYGDTPSSFLFQASLIEK